MLGLAVRPAQLCVVGVISSPLTHVWLFPLSPTPTPCTSVQSCSRACHCPATSWSSADTAPWRSGKTRPGAWVPVPAGSPSQMVTPRTLLSFLSLFTLRPGHDLGSLSLLSSWAHCPVLGQPADETACACVCVTETKHSEHLFVLSNAASQAGRRDSSDSSPCSRTELGWDLLAGRSTPVPLAAQPAQELSS